MAKPKSKALVTPTESKVEVAQMIELSPAAQQSQSGKLIELAMSKGELNMEVLERLIKLKNDEEALQAKKEYFAALSEFKHLCPKLTKNKNVKFDHRKDTGKTDYWYTDLGEIEEQIKEPLFQCGLSYNWRQSEKDNKISVSAVIRHRNGHEEVGEPLDGFYDSSGNKNQIQQKASTITYLRRYTLTGILGLSSADKDNDGRDGAAAADGVDNLPFDSAKIKLNDAQMQTAVKNILNGTETLASIEEKAMLSDTQREALQITENSRNQKAEKTQA